MLVITCPGQGAQKSGFFESFLELETFSAQIDELAAASGIDLRAHGTTSDDETIKDTALASVVAMPDLLKQATQAQALAANPSPLIGAAAIYLAFLLPAVLLVTRLERRFNRGNA